MTFFAQVTKPSKATFETVEPQRVAWNRGIDHLDPETRNRVNALFVGSSPVKKGYVYKNTTRHNGKTITQWAREYGVNHATATWHIEKYGNMDRCLQDYHKTRAGIHWGQTIKDWTAFINDPTLTTGHIRSAITKGKDNFERYIFKKTGITLTLKGE
tara:strand:+ start:1969 stop:2439 length:471 start_codon:yes stop_codon:yes gene_type:complete